MKDIIEDDKNALYDKFEYNSFDFTNQLNTKVDSTDTKNEAMQHTEDAKVTSAIGNHKNVIKYKHFSDEGH